MRALHTVQPLFIYQKISKYTVNLICFYFSLILMALFIFCFFVLKKCFFFASRFQCEMITYKVRR